MGDVSLILPDKRTVAGEVFDRLRRAILQGRFPPGSRLNEVALSELLGVSRTPVREALFRLGEEKLVEYIPHRGVFVRQMSREEAQESFQVRQALEGMAAMLAAEQAQPADCARLEDILVRMESGGLGQDVSQAIDANDDLHAAIAAIAGNELLARTAASLRAALRLLRASNWLKQRSATALVEHRQIVAAVQAGDPQSARALMEEHIHQAWVTVDQLMWPRVAGKSAGAAGDGG